MRSGCHPFKKGIAKLNAWYTAELEALHVPVYFSSALTADNIKSLKPDVVILAVGSEHFVPKIAGYDNSKTSVCLDVLMGDKKTGDRVVVVGGGLTGSELAYDLAAYEHKKVTLVEALDDILSAGMPVPQAVDNMLRDLLSFNNVDIMTGNKIVAVNDKGAVVENKDGVQTVIEADDVVFAIGLRPNSSLNKELSDCGIDVFETGDGTGVGNIRTAISGAYEITRGI